MVSSPTWRLNAVYFKIFYKYAQVLKLQSELKRARVQGSGATGGVGALLLDLPFLCENLVISMHKWSTFLN